MSRLRASARWASRVRRDRSRGPLAVSLTAASLAARDVDREPRTGRWDIGIDEVP